MSSLDNSWPSVISPGCTGSYLLLGPVAATCRLSSRPSSKAPTMSYPCHILDALWGVDCSSSCNVVDQQVRNLRTKLHDTGPEPRFIATESGQGYRFIPMPTAVAVEAGPQPVLSR